MLTTTLSWNTEWDMWSFYNNPNPDDNFKVIFDGYTRTIWILEGVQEILVRENLYSDWKKWMLISDNQKWLRAFAVEGGIPTSDTEATGVTYFLINDWTIRQRTGGIPTTVDGNLYGYVDEGTTPKYPYLPDEDGLISINSKVSNIIDQISVETTTPSLTPEQEWILQMAYEEARRSRAMQTNKVTISTIGTGDSAVDNIIVYDDDGVTELYRIQVTGQDADNRTLINSKDYCPKTTPPTPCE